MQRVQTSALKADNEVKAHYVEFTATSASGETTRGMAFATEKYMQDHIQDASFGDPNGNVARFLLSEIMVIESLPAEELEANRILVYANDITAARQYVLKTYTYLSN